MRARAGRTQIAYLKGAEPIDDLLVRRADQLIKVNSITTPRLRRERFSWLGRLLSLTIARSIFRRGRRWRRGSRAQPPASGLAEVVAGLVAELVESLRVPGRATPPS